MSKALDKQIKSAPVSWPLLKEMSFVHYKRAVVMETFDLSPEWNGDKIMKSLVRSSRHKQLIGKNGSENQCFKARGR